MVRVAKTHPWSTDKHDNSDFWQVCWLTLVGLALKTQLVSDIWSDLFGPFCDFNLGLLLSANLGAGYWYKFWPVSVPDVSCPFPFHSIPCSNNMISTYIHTEILYNGLNQFILLKKLLPIPLTLFEGVNRLWERCLHDYSNAVLSFNSEQKFTMRETLFLCLNRD